MSKVTPTQRTLARLKKEGCRAGVVERWLAYAGSFGVRQDLFGFIDIIALDRQYNPMNGTGIIGIQACAASGLSAHLTKIRRDCGDAALDWLTAGGRIQVWAWRKVKMIKADGTKGKADRWQPKIVNVDHTGLVVSPIKGPIPPVKRGNLRQKAM